MSRLGLTRAAQLQRICRHDYPIAPTHFRCYARRAPSSRRARVAGVPGLEGLEEVDGVERLANLKEMGSSEPEEIIRRIEELEGLSGGEILKKLEQYEQGDRNIPAFEGDDKNVHYPNLMNPDPILDMHEALDFPPTRDNPYTGRVILRNDPSVFQAEKERLAAEGDLEAQRELEAKSRNPDEGGDEEDSQLAALPLSKSELSRLYRFPLIHRRVTQQTGKGKIHRMYSLMVVGNGNGLVGYGEGKDEDATRAADKAFAEAVRRMDTVERFEKRTLWTDMETKLGATKIILRPRPLGFGLACNPNIHQVLKAAGIKDASAKVWGSRNPLNVIKALFRMIHAGNAPLSMGNGIGGGARKLDKGIGIRGKEVVERERGRRLIDLRTW